MVCTNAANVTFAARCGGHSFEAMSLVPGGLVIDVSRLPTLNLIKDDSSECSSLGRGCKEHMCV